MLAHSSIENAGISPSASARDWSSWRTICRRCAAIAFVAAGYHLTNHSFYKTLLLMGAAAVEAGRELGIWTSWAG